MAAPAQLEHDPLRNFLPLPVAVKCSEELQVFLLPNSTDLVLVISHEILIVIEYPVAWIKRTANVFLIFFSLSL